MTQCEECGARNAENATFCVRCGAELSHGADAPAGENTDTLAPVTEDAAAGPEAVPADAPEDASADVAADPSADFTAVAEPLEAPEVVDDDGAGAGREAEALLSEASERLADGDADGAAAKCREAIEVAPDLVSAYSLLGMAEEQRGNTMAAAGAYRRVLQLDPDRKVEREKLEALYADGVASPHGEDEGRDGRGILAWAPWVAAVAAAFFVMMTLTAVGLRVHASNEAERLHAEQMTTGKAALDSGDYREAASAFETALMVAPDDAEAQRGLRYARRKMASRTTVASSASANAARQETYQASIVPSRGPNPFPDIPIGPANADRDEPEPAQGQPPQTRQTRNTPPPVMSRDERVEVNRRSPATTRPTEEAMPFQPEVLDAPAEEVASDEESAPAADEPEETEAVEEKPQGEISIWLSPRSGGQSESEASRPQETSSAQHGDRAQSLRRQAQSAVQQGNYQRGQQLVDQAIEQYRADTAANPAKRQANQAAINTLQTLRQQCEVGEDQ